MGNDYRCAGRFFFTWREQPPSNVAVMIRLVIPMTGMKINLLMRCSFFFCYVRVTVVGRKAIANWRKNSA